MSDAKADAGLRRLFTGQSNYEIVARSPTWALISLALIAVAVGGVALRGLNFSIEFTGGTAFLVERAQSEFDAKQLRTAVGQQVQGNVLADRLVDRDSGQVGATVTTPVLGDVGGQQERAIQQTIADITGVEPSDVSRDSVGPRWGEQVTERALWALAAFLALVSAYIALRFEWRMAVSAFLTLLHDILLTVGIYALVGFEVSPASIIALLTILGYSLYDTVVVFDRVSEDTAGYGPTATRTYGEIANGSLNRVMLRSISTSATSLLPVGSLLLIGGQLLGADTLTDLALALFIGMAVGTYSSIFVATPALVWLAERDPELARIKADIISRRGGEAAAALAGAGAGERRGKATGGSTGGARDGAKSGAGGKAPRSQAASRDKKKKKRSRASRGP
jgi:preprotein translocase subunit SecF